MTEDGTVPAGPGCIHDRFRERAAERGDAPAVSCGEETLTYARLDERAEQLAERLRSLSVGPESLVGVCMERSPRLVVALLAVLKAGGAYLPLDPAHPEERLRGMLTDSGASVVLTDSAERDFGAALVLGPDGERREGDTGTSAADRFTAAPASAETTSAASARLPHPGPTARPENLAYVIYTSGSTGAPKGVMVEHRQVTRLLSAAQQHFGFGPEDNWTLFHSPAFDFSVWEIWGALCSGGRLTVVPREVSRSPEEFYELLAAEQITVLNQTPAAFRQLMQVDEKRAGTRQERRLALRTVVFGGEALEPETLRPWVARHGTRTPALVNMYGITETTVHVTHRPLTAGVLEDSPGSVIGWALPGMHVAVLDESGSPVSTGEAGEIFVGGSGVARGYLGRPDLTAERFLPDPDAARPGARRYRSGDLARLTEDGDLEYRGRTDHQVKVRGHRIELAEIETALSGHPAIREAVVVARPDVIGEQTLVAYVVTREGRGDPGGDGDAAAAPGPSELRAHLARTLPAYMLPGLYVVLERLPLTANGKVDRAALPVPETARPELALDYAAPRGSLETSMAAVWAGALGVDEVGLDDDFFELGGHSLLATQVVAETEERFGARVPLRLLFDEPTVRGFTAALRERGLASADAGTDPSGQGEHLEQQPPGGSDE